MVSQKCQYAIRAIFELARRYGDVPVKICDIADAQAIPPRFLEVILGQLKQAGFVQSRRGAAGGYLLARQPSKITVGEIIQYVEGPLVPVECMIGKAAKECTLHGNCAFIGMWERATKAVSDVYNQISLQDLLDEDAKRQNAASIAYAI
jgi:Rrf2 family protein